MDLDRHFYRESAMQTYGQIPLDGPDRTGPDPTRQVFTSRVSDSVSDIVCFLLNSTTRARPDFVVDFPRKARLENPDLFTATCFSNVAVMGSLDVRPSVCL